MDLKLCAPSIHFRTRFAAMARAYQEAGEVRYQEVDLSEAGFSEYIKRLVEGAASGPADPHLVPQTAFGLFDADSIIGVVRIRHQLNPSLLVEGGHIGYDINPLYRGRGYGHTILQRALMEAKRIGIARVLITCDSDNIASRKMIEAARGILENEVVSLKSGKPIRRYWIDCSG